MKDKLVKTGHRRSYYRFRSILIAGSFLLCGAAISAMPIAITYQMALSGGGAKADVGSESSLTQTTEEISSSEPLTLQ